ncbi:MAG TPA: glycosyltransferase [Thermoanaerobaculia bacterium]|nr:glycosyltransferase [Thermoanaerobaculia bacterium]
MAKLAFLLDQEEGHLLPSFKLARDLTERGHSVRYLGLADSEGLVRQHGLEFSPILEHAFPKGTIRKAKELSWEHSGSNPGLSPSFKKKLQLEQEMETYRPILGPLVRGELDGPLREVRPDLLILNSFRPLNALILHFRYQLPVVLLTPFLRSVSKAHHAQVIGATLTNLPAGVTDFLQLVKRTDPSVRRLDDLVSRFLAMRELIQCPRDLELPELLRTEPEVHHIESCVDLTPRSCGGFPWEKIDSSKRLLYCSLGSQPHVYGRERVIGFLRAVVAGMAQRPGWQLVLSGGSLLGPGDLPGLPADAIVCPWVPQLAILDRAAVMVTHGGLGTVKECIFQGVPMIVYPMTNDQPLNARRVVHHRLGLSGEDANATPDEIFSRVEKVHQDAEIRTSMERMRRRFREMEDSGTGPRLIEEVLTQAPAFRT